MINGIIVKGIGGFYYVKTDNQCIYECEARGIFRKENIIPAVGDIVKIEVKDDGKGVINEIGERENYLVRPPVANIDLAIIVFAFTKPKPNLFLLDKFLVTLEKNNVHTCICFNKADLVDSKIKDQYTSIYKNTGYKVLSTSTKTEEGMERLKEILKGRISIFSGPSGVGKSSLLNQIQPGLKLKTGDISTKSRRGKHTTRHVELLRLDFGGSVLDTPGFTALGVSDIEEDELQYFFPEFIPYLNSCRFNGCRHLHEPKCHVKEQVASRNISSSRYDSYVAILKEIQEQRRYKYD